MKYELEMAELERKSIAKGRTEGRTQGRAEGRAEGQANAYGRMGKLIIYLQEHSLTDELTLAATNNEAREEMFKKYHIE